MQGTSIARWRRLAPLSQVGRALARQRSEALHAISVEFASRLGEFIALEGTGRWQASPSTEKNCPTSRIRCALRGAARVLSARQPEEYVAGTTTFVRREPLGVVAGITP